MIIAKWKLYIILIIIANSSFSIMAQSDLKICNENTIIATSNNTFEAATILKSYLDQSFTLPIAIQKDKALKLDSNTKIYLQITSEKNIEANSFIIESNDQNVYLTAPNQKTLRYAIYTFLEYLGFRKITATENYIPENPILKYPKNKKIICKPSFEYRSLFYPDTYDESFRDWHKLDWHINDFKPWGHSFDHLLPPKKYFKNNPKLYALYEGERRGESLCMTNDTVVKLMVQEIEKFIKNNPEATFYSISQNDDVVYCECAKCEAINKKNDGPQGSLYYFLNKIAVHFPNIKIATLAYLHTYKPPTNITIASNIYTILCPIEINHGKPIITDEKSVNFKNLLKKWSTTTQNLYLWDYTVQFSNYLSPFPNLHTFAENYKLYKNNNVKGIFAQGYADVPGDFSELRQYLLAKLLWDTNIDIELTTNDFLRAYYGKAAPAIQKYITLLTKNQEKTNQFLDIYSGPIQTRGTFLDPESMNQYDQLIEEAQNAVKGNELLQKKVIKLRLALEYAYFEQSKFYGKDQHGMFIINKKGHKEVREGLTQRVKKFTQSCNQAGVYELSEGGLSPNQYYEEWIDIVKNATQHLGENLKINFITNPSEDYKGKGPYGLVDGNRGSTNFNINWLGWYGNNPEIEIETNKINFNQLKLNFLEDQRHWIFTPQKITVYGLLKNDWQLIAEETLEPITDNTTPKVKSWGIKNPEFNHFAKLKIIIQNQDKLPSWRKRKYKKPMVMIDEIELYNKQL